jgi:hypothetical protein
LDGKDIIDSIIELKQDMSWVKKYEKFPSPELKIIDMQNDFFNVTINNGSRYTGQYQHPQEFAQSPKIYKAIGICICGVIDSNLLTPGEHTLLYHIGYSKSQSPVKSTDAKYTLEIK